MGSVHNCVDCGDDLCNLLDFQKYKTTELRNQQTHHDFALIAACDLIFNDRALSSTIHYRPQAICNIMDSFTCDRPDRISFDMLCGLYVRCIRLTTEVRLFSSLK